MYGIISSPDFSSDIQHVLQLQNETIIFNKVGRFNSDEFQNLCSSAASIAIDTLIVDITCCHSDPAIIKGIRKYRIIRSSRVIIIAPNRVPGDSTISALVAEGVYDIIAPSVPNDDELDIKPLLENQIAKKYHMGNAARWRNLNEDVSDLHESELNESKTNDQKQNARAWPELSEEDFDFSLPREKQKVIVTERIFGTMTVAVGGADRRTGSTHTALAIGKILSSHGKTAVVEMFNPSVIPSVFHLYDHDPSVHYTQGYHYDGVDLFPAMENDNWLDELYAHYDYLVLDFGSLWIQDHPTPFIKDFLRSHVRILTMGSSDWDFDRFSKTLRFLKQQNWIKPMYIYVHFCEEKRFKHLMNTFSSSERKELNIQFIRASYTPASIPLTRSDFKNLQQMLNQIIPQKKKRFW